MRCVVFLVSLFFGLSAIADIATIHLVDGSRIRGELQSLTEGKFTILSADLGTISIPESKVRLVEYGASKSTTEHRVDDSILNSVQSRLSSNPNILATLQSLQNDPDVLAVMNDEQIQRAIRMGDYTSLMNNPKIIRLMQNSTIKEITREVR